MFYELTRAAIQKIFQDKILMGLVIVGLLAIFIGGFGSGPDQATTGPRQENVQPTSQSPANDSPPGSNAATKVEPQLAADFIKWWVGNAMDFNAATCRESHNQAQSWMTPEAAQTFQSTFWSPATAEAVQTGRLAANFQANNIQAIAVNPDGSVVVTVSGNLMLQQGPRPAVQQFMVDFLVKKDTDGLRVAGLYNRSPATLSSSIY